MRIQEIWRYPVKSMAGELLDAADLTEAGIAGDRIVQVRNAGGRVMTSRTRPLLLRHEATLTSDNQVLVDGRPWDSEEVARDVEAAAGANLTLEKLEELQIRKVLQRTPNLGEAAAILGIDQTTLYRKRKKLGLE
jgi:hypothetical protein